MNFNHSKIEGWASALELESESRQKLLSTQPAPAQVQQLQSFLEDMDEYHRLVEGIQTYPSTLPSPLVRAGRREISIDEATRMLVVTNELAVVGGKVDVTFTRQLEHRWRPKNAPDTSKNQAATNDENTKEQSHASTSSETQTSPKTAASSVQSDASAFERRAAAGLSQLSPPSPQKTSPPSIQKSNEQNVSASKNADTGVRPTPAASSARQSTTSFERRAAAGLSQLDSYSTDCSVPKTIPRRANPISRLP